MKKERPILFSTPMVQALLAGRKTQTRRIVKPQPCSRATEFYNSIKGGWPKTPWHARLELPKDPGYYEVTDLYKCPYGAIGDVLYGKECFLSYGKWGESKDTKNKSGYEWRRLLSEPILFEADGPYIKPVRGIEWSMGYKWRKVSSLFLEKSAARIWLEITDIRAERVQEISEAEAIAEGIIETTSGDSGIPGKWYKDYLSDASGYGHPDDDFPIVSNPIESYASLWQSINGPDSWQANPWVWVVTFKVLSTTHKPETLNNQI